MGRVSELSSALPDPRSPALCRKDTTYPWSNRLRSRYNMVRIFAMMMVIVGDGDGDGDDDDDNDDDEFMFSVN